MHTNMVLVIDRDRRPLDPVTPATAGVLLRTNKARVHRLHPFTIRVKGRAHPSRTTQQHSIKIDPGSRYTGIAVVNQRNQVIFAMELEHRGQAIKAALLSRSQIRRGRRSRNTRYRQARFDNRTRPAGWLPPSLQHRLLTIDTWVARIRRYCCVTAIAVESVKFDMQLMQDPAIEGRGYQQGTLLNFTVKEYLLERHNRTCAYCGVTAVPLEIEHIIPRSRRGSNNLSNLTLACRPCNQAKGSSTAAEYLATKPGLLSRIQATSKVRLSDAAAVNATRLQLVANLSNIVIAEQLDRSTGEIIQTMLPCSIASGAQTKLNRTSALYPKTHWIDAACVGDSGATVQLNPRMLILHVRSIGQGHRQVVRTDRFGFPAARPRRSKTLTTPLGVIKTGDIVSLTQPNGLYAGEYQHRRITAINVQTRNVSLSINGRQTWLHSKLVTHIHQRADGYSYSVQCAS